MEIDWSKAPAGTTHWDPVDRNHLMQFGKVAMMWDISKGWIKKGWQYPDDLSTMPRLIARPVWNGEGLPPAGTVCELRNVAAGTAWSEATIVFASRNVVVWDWVGEPMVNGLCTAYAHAVEMRPVRTPEQIAAEEREEEVKAMTALNPDENPNQALTKWLCEALYDAGYRKQEPKPE